ncbi:serine protein kinase RIO [Candidatus Woesearchaeota archaeon]|nr:serine protein kinase RIO [Candidatus Woesearchaeota archaeon]
MAKKTREKFKVMKNVFDMFTLRTLFDLESKGHFIEDTLVPISVGKESNIFWGESEQDNVIVKIYRVQSCDFNRMYDYIKHDPRFLKMKRQRRKVILSWVQREYRNLLNAREAGVKAPIPYAILNNVIVMEMIGDEVPAAKLKDDLPEKPKEFFNDIVDMTKRFYKYGYVHGDLSHFNILNYNQKPVFIDFSQSTTLNNPSAEEYLERDINVVSEFFRKLGVKVDEKKVLKKIRS